MTRIGLLSDTHGYLHPKVFEFFTICDVIWHAGDIGNLKTAETLQAFRPLTAVYGNIDGADVRMVYPLVKSFSVESVKVLMTHIGGYPGRYEKGMKELFLKERPGIFVAGHSHILKVMFDKKNNFLYINPGAAGKYGFHQSITMVRFVIDGSNIRDLQVMDIPRNSEQ
jgi:putative phosphoesterase